jgi:hypothetical protein
MRVTARLLAGGFTLALMGAAAAAAAATKTVANPLEIRISLPQSLVTEPRPAHVKLKFKNLGGQTLWLYRPVRRPEAESGLGSPGRELGQAGPTPTRGGSSLEVSLAPQVKRQAPPAPGPSGVLSSIGIPHPKLVRLKPGAEAEEDVWLHLSPAQIEQGGKRRPLWGTYHLSVTYRAGYSNRAAILKDLGVGLWQGEIASNTVPVTLAPSGGRGSIEGTVINSISETVSNALVTLTTAHEDLLEQASTDGDGRFAFRDLPWGLYWAIARQPGRRTANVVYRHAVVGAAAPTASLELMLIPRRAYDAKRLLHKPALFRVVGASGQPLEAVKVEALFANGRVVETVQGQSAADGTVALELIPGPNFITFKQRGCRSEERRVDVSSGGGVSGFEFKLACRKK